MNSIQFEFDGFTTPKVDPLADNGVGEFDWDLLDRPRRKVPQIPDDDAAMNSGQLEFGEGFITPKVDAG